MYIAFRVIYALFEQNPLIPKTTDNLLSSRRPYLLNRIYNKILDHDCFSTCLFVT